MRRAPALCLVLALGCTAVDDRTQVIVMVGGDDSIRELDVTIENEAGTEVSSKRTIDLALREPGRLPTSFTVLAPRGAESARFRVLLRGYALAADGARIARAEQQVVAELSKGRTTLLPIVLARECAAMPCPCTTAEACQTCTTVSTFRADGTLAPSAALCRDVPVFTELSEVEPGFEQQTLYDGAGGCARGSAPDVTGECADVDECAFNDPCSGPPAICVNQHFSRDRYQCRCPEGYDGEGAKNSPCVLPS